LKNAKFDLFSSEKCQLANLVANRDWIIVTVLQATACTVRHLSNYNGMTAYICRRFIPTTAFLVCRIKMTQNNTLNEVQFM